jgi:hypothetical protein
VVDHVELAKIFISQHASAFDDLQGFAIELFARWLNDRSLEACLERTEVTGGIQDNI